MDSFSQRANGCGWYRKNKLLETEIIYVRSWDVNIWVKWMEQENGGKRAYRIHLFKEYIQLHSPEIEYLTQTRQPLVF